MKAMIFAAGLGTRLKPLTDNSPKALVEVGGIPMLGRVIEKLKDAGVTEMVVNVHHFPDMIIDYLRANNNFDAKIIISDERNLLLDTGGGVRKAAPQLDGDEPILLHNADILTDFDLRAMENAFFKAGADAMLLVGDRATSRYLLMDSDNRLRGWTNLKTGEVRHASLDADGMHRKAFGGVHIISPAALHALENYNSETDKFSITPFYVEMCSSLDIRGYEPDEPYRWFDVGRPDTLEAARQSV
ncbi:MAG: nucleotidyltransferase family protein [Firmicutes bacterium]|nr:nucleotidyltransferase family protein [Bacillota bacterium]MCM1400800.1 nucleotidyltransferase family protein [Bacteroides sp.]MCM1477653.1 nucleotidyltransferase family protein [Bacteroides sp.]